MLVRYDPYSRATHKIVYSSISHIFDIEVVPIQKQTGLSLHTQI